MQKHTRGERLPDKPQTRAHTDALNLSANQTRFTPQNSMQKCPLAGFKTTCSTLPLAQHENKDILKMNLMTLSFQKTFAIRDNLQKVLKFTVVLSNSRCANTFNMPLKNVIHWRRTVFIFDCKMNQK